MRKIISIIIMLVASGISNGGIILDQPPNQNGGPAADTSFYDESGIERWQELADDIFLAQPATLRRIIWHGFYGDSLKNNPEPLPLSETMRIRIYDDSADLPNAVLFEESFLNPSRVATGLHVFTGPDPPEQRYQVDLGSSFQLQANTRYWLSISQVGDPNSLFRWEFSQGNGSPLVFRSVIFPNWRPSGLVSNLSFQLSDVPEPGCCIWVLGATVLLRRRGISKNVSIVF